MAVATPETLGDLEEAHVPVTPHTPIFTYPKPEAVAPKQSHSPPLLREACHDPPGTTPTRLHQGALGPGGWGRVSAKPPFPTLQTPRAHQAEASSQHFRGQKSLG